MEAETKTEEDGTVQSFASYGMSTYNRFQPLEKLADKEFPERQTHVRRSTAGYGRRPYPAVICPGAVQVQGASRTTRAAPRVPKGASKAPKGPQQKQPQPL